MASPISHAVAALGIGAVFYKPDLPKRTWVLGVACSIFLDADVIGFHFGIRYGDFWGHRGFTHSLLFAVILATSLALFAFRNIAPVNDSCFGSIFSWQLPAMACSTP